METVLVVGVVVAAIGVGGYLWFNKAVAKQKTPPPSDHEHFGSQYNHGGQSAPAPVVKTTPKMGYNPLKLTKGSRVLIDDGDISGVVFVTSEIQCYLEKVQGASYPFTDYLLVSLNPEVGNEFASQEDNRIYIRLRVIRPEHDVDGGAPEVMVYWLQESRPMDKSWIKTQILDNGGKFTLPGLINDEEWAVFDSLDPTPEPHEAVLTWYRDDDGDGALTEGEAIASKIEYWAFRRAVDYEGEEFDQYTVVHVNQDTGIIDVFVGWAVGVKSVRVS